MIDKDLFPFEYGAKSYGDLLEPVQSLLRRNFF